MNTYTEKTQVKLLRDRYYSNLTFLDLMSKTYGELDFFKQTSLYVLALGISTAGIILVNPMLFIMGAVSLNFLYIIGLQYQALETRFSQLVKDLEESEKRLEKAVAENVELAAELKEVSIKQEKLFEELEEGRLEIQKMTQKIQENKRVVADSCEVFEKYGQKSQQIAQKLFQVEEDVTQKGEQCMALLTQLSGIVTQALNDLNYISENSMEKKLAEQNEYLTRLETYLDETYGDILDSGDDKEFEQQSRYSFS